MVGFVVNSILRALGTSLKSINDVTFWVDVPMLTERDIAELDTVQMSCDGLGRLTVQAG